MNDNACIYLHLDWHIGHYVKILLDEVFGEENFINEIVWGYKDIGAKAVPYFKRSMTRYFYIKFQKKEFLMCKGSSFQKAQLKDLEIILMKTGKSYISGLKKIILVFL